MWIFYFCFHDIFSPLINVCLWPLPFNPFQVLWFLYCALMCPYPFAFLISFCTFHLSGPPAPRENGQVTCVYLHTAKCSIELTGVSSLISFLHDRCAYLSFLGQKKNLNQNKENYGWWGKLTSWWSTTRKCCFQIKPHFENPSQHELGGILCLYKWVFLFRTIYVWLDLYFFCILMNEEQMVLSQC